MRRRDFVRLLGGATAWPLAARAQQPDRMRRIGVLFSGTDDDPASERFVTALREGLLKLGWTEGRNLRIDERFARNDPGHFHGYAEELVRLAPEVIVVSGVRATRALQELTQTIPIVFTQVGDPVISGVVKSIAHPEGNATGTTNLFLSIAGKWLGLLKEVAPRVARIALLFNPNFTGSENYVSSIEGAAGAIPLRTVKLPVRSTAEIEHAIDTFSAEPNGGLIAVPPNFDEIARALMVRLSAQHGLPAVYPDKDYVTAGGLMSYGVDTADLYRSGASMYVDRLLRGAKVSELPVQFPTKFELAINLKTAKALGLTIPAILQATADEVIE
jgi:putative ABC transport system substrate-binding protein